MAKVFNANEAFELHKAAVLRDFIAKPRLGTYCLIVNARACAPRNTLANPAMP